MSNLAAKLKGVLLVIDGPDGAGKSTQARLLAQWLGETAAGLEVLHTRDPGGTAIGDKVRSILLDKAHLEMCVECELMLYMASRAQLVRQVIRPALARGACVLCDRYVSSTIAYQGAGGVDLKSVRAAADIAVGGVWPKLTLVLDLPSDQGLDRAMAGRGDGDRMEAKAREFHRKVRELFLRQAQEDPMRFEVVDAGGSEQQVQERLRAALLRRFP